MFSPNCIIVLPSPEIAIKGNQVRAFMQKKLKKNIILYLKHFKVHFGKIVSSAGRIIIYTEEPKKVVSALKNCFGINAIFIAESKKFSSLEELCSVGVDVSRGFFENGTFAVRGKSFSNAFSSKKLEEELGFNLLEAFPKLKVKLKGPEHEVFCLAYKEKAFFYFSHEKCAKGMPVGVQGVSGVVVFGASNENDLLSVAKDLLHTGCSVVFAGEKPPAAVTGLGKFNCFRPFKHYSFEEAKALYASGEITAFFSAVKTEADAEKESASLGVKVFAPLLFSAVPGS